MNLLSLRRLPVLALRTPGAALSVAAAALRVLADVNQHLAATLKGAAPAATTSPAPSVVASPAAAQAALPADITTLAALPAARLLPALESLSTQDLAELYEHEARHRRRRQVLDAIEVAAAPPVQARDEIVLDDVRQPDELVYTTSTPRA